MNSTSPASVVSDIVLESPVHVGFSGQWSVTFENRINIIFENMYSIENETNFLNQ